MGLIGSTITIVSVTLFTLYIFNASLTVYLLWNPTTYVPYFRPKPSFGPNPSYHRPYYTLSQTFDLSVYLSSSKHWGTFENAKIIWRAKSLTFENSTRSADLNFTIDPSQSIFLHAFLTQHRRSPNPHRPTYDPLAIHFMTEITKVMPILINDTRSLLGNAGIDDHRNNNLQHGDILPHWKPKISLELIHDQNSYPQGHIPLDIAPYFLILQQEPKQYLPILIQNDMGLRREDWIPIDSKHPVSLPLHITFKRGSLGLFRLRLLMDGAFDLMLRSDSAFHISEKEVENLKTMIFEVNPTLLAITIFASMLHVLFEFLALKEDIVHFRQIDISKGGISHMSLGLNMLNKIIVVGYLLDKRNETSMLVIGGSIATLLVDIWKYVKSLDLTINSRSPSQPETELQRISREADHTAVKYVFLISTPLLTGYAIWSLLFWKHKSFWSWGIDIAMAGVYMIEFVQMLPQLFINYRLKSVEAMSLTAFLYRAINTFVDDLFAFVIPMPNLTRLSAFRDDIVFVVLMIQWWIYPKKRTYDDIKTDNVRNENKNEKEREGNMIKKNIDIKEVKKRGVNVNEKVGKMRIN